MIKATELRLGNYVRSWEKGHGGKPAKITLSMLRTLSKVESFQEYLAIKPISLTPELLEKCGFEKATSEDIEERTIYYIQVANNTSLYFDPHKDWMRNNYEVEWYLSHEWNNNHFKNDFRAKPKYLHQLQNLFFALTGTELTVNL